MTGFFTLLSFATALTAGGWFWMGFIIMLLVWGAKLAEKEKMKAKNGLPEPQMPPGDTLEVNSRDPHAGADWRKKLTEVCSRYASPGFYVAELIPQDKLKNALKTYPFNGGGQQIALIDAAFFASAENGMLIGEHGLCWHHWSVNGKVSSMLWTEFSELAITVDGSKINIGSDAVFETAGTSFDINEIVSLLKLIGEMWAESIATVENPPSDEPEVTKPMPLPPEASEPPKLGKTDINTANFDSLLALPGIGAADAKLIAQHIQSNGPLASIDEMSKVLNLKPHIIERLRPLVTFSTIKPEPSELPKLKPPTDPAAEQHPVPPKAQGPVRAPIDF